MEVIQGFIKKLAFKIVKSKLVTSDGKFHFVKLDEDQRKHDHSFNESI